MRVMYERVAGIDVHTTGVQRRGRPERYTARSRPCPLLAQAGGFPASACQPRRGAARPLTSVWATSASAGAEVTDGQIAQEVALGFVVSARADALGH